LTKTIELGVIGPSPPRRFAAAGSIHGKLMPEDREVLTAEDAKRLFIPQPIKERILKRRRTRFFHRARRPFAFSVNIFQAKEKRSAGVFRAIYLIKTFEDLGLPPVVADLCASRADLFSLRGRQVRVNRLRWQR
jgi:twitching motility protein PilT